MTFTIDKFYPAVAVNVIVVVCDCVVLDEVGIYTCKPNSSVAFTAKSWIHDDGEIVNNFGDFPSCMIDILNRLCPGEDANVHVDVLLACTVTLPIGMFPLFVIFAQLFAVDSFPLNAQLGSHVDSLTNIDIVPCGFNVTTIF